MADGAPFSCSGSRREEVRVVHGPVADAHVLDPSPPTRPPEGPGEGAADGRRRLARERRRDNVVVGASAERAVRAAGHGIARGDAVAARAREERLVQILARVELPGELRREVAVVQRGPVVGLKREADGPEAFLAAGPDRVEALAAVGRDARLDVEQEGREARVHQGPRLRIRQAHDAALAPRQRRRRPERALEGRPLDDLRQRRQLLGQRRPLRRERALPRHPPHAATAQREAQNTPHHSRSRAARDALFTTSGRNHHSGKASAVQPASAASSRGPRRASGPSGGATREATMSAAKKQVGKYEIGCVRGALPVVGAVAAAAPPLSAPCHGVVPLGARSAKGPSAR